LNLKSDNIAKQSSQYTYIWEIFITYIYSLWFRLNFNTVEDGS
jgi:hypothetical protein